MAASLLCHLLLRTGCPCRFVFASGMVSYGCFLFTSIMTSWRIWTILLWSFLSPLLHFEDDGMCGLRPSEKLRACPCYCPQICWSLPSFQISTTSLFVWVPLYAPSSLCNLLCSGRDPYGNNSISSCHVHWVTGVMALAIWGSAHL